MNKLKIIQASIVGVALVWILSAFMVQKAQKSRLLEIQEKLDKQKKVERLEKSWQTLEQQRQLASFEKFLEISVGSFIKKDKDKTFFYSVLLNADNANATVNYVLGKPLIVKSFSIRQLDLFTLELDLEVER